MYQPYGAKDGDENEGKDEIGSERHRKVIVFR